ncbi:uncharacterized protein A4U43_C06F19850, partial [Asparagus officinalis]
VLKTIETYRKYSYAQAVPANEIQPKSYEEYLGLKGRVEILQRSQRNLLGEDLTPLSTKELEQLENQVAMSLKQIRLTK